MATELYAIATRGEPRELVNQEGRGIRLICEPTGITDDPNGVLTDEIQAAVRRARERLGLPALQVGTMPEGRPDAASDSPK